MQQCVREIFVNLKKANSIDHTLSYKLLCYSWELTKESKNTNIIISRPSMNFHIFLSCFIKMILGDKKYRFVKALQYNVKSTQHIRAFYRM